MHIKTYFIDGILTVKDKDLYKFLGGKLRPLDEFRKWEEYAVSTCDYRREPRECWTLDGGGDMRKAGRFFSIKKCMELTEDPILKEKLWNLS